MATKAEESLLGPHVAQTNFSLQQRCSICNFVHNSKRHVMCCTVQNPYQKTEYC